MRTDSHTAYEAVRQLRPGFLLMIPVAVRGTADPQPTIVFVNSYRAGGLDALQLIPASAVRTIRVVKPMHTVTQLGKGLSGGAILVETR